MKKIVSLILVLCMMITGSNSIFASNSELDDYEMEAVSREEYLTALMEYHGVSMEEAVRIETNAKNCNGLSRVVPEETAYVTLTKTKNIGSGYSLKCSVYCMAIVDFATKKPLEFVTDSEGEDAIAITIRVAGDMSSYSWNGSEEADITRSKLTVYANGTITLKVNSSVTLGSGFIMSGTVGTTTTWKYYVDGATFIWTASY